MEAFTVEIAGLAVRVQPLFQSTREYCKPYLTDKAPEFFVDVTAEDLVFQQSLLDREAVEEGIKFRKFTDPFLERATIQRKVADQLLSQNTLMLHGSTVSVDGEAYLFTGPCGTGKSTHTRLWCQLFGQRAQMVNDDKPFLAITPQGTMAYGSPWNGKHGLSNPIGVPLRGICILQRGGEDRIWPIGPEEALPMLRSQVTMPLDPKKHPHLEELLVQLAETVPLWRMECTPQLCAAQTAYAAMAGQ